MSHSLPLLIESNFSHFSCPKSTFLPTDYSETSFQSAQLLSDFQRKKKMPLNGESTPPPRIGKIGPYTVFITPPATPSPTPASRPDAADSPKKPSPATPTTWPPVQPPVQTPPPVQAPPSKFYTSKPPVKSHSTFGFFWNAVAKVQTAHASLDEHVAYWFGLDQSRYQWALDDYYESQGMNPKDVKAKDLPKAQNV